MRRNETIFINMIDSSLSTQVAKTLSRFFAGVTGGVLEQSIEVVLQLLAGSCSDMRVEVLKTEQNLHSTVSNRGYSDII